MTGILEQIVSQQASILQGIQQLLNGHTAGLATVAPAQPAQPAPVDPFASMTPAAPVAPVAVTEAQVMGLIEPHLDNVAVKGALSQVLTAMGIARLPDARPDQYGEMYQKFAAVIQQHAAAAPAPAAPTTII